MKAHTKKNAPSAIPVGRTKERPVDVPDSADVATTITANPTETMAVPTNFWQLAEAERSATPHLREVVEEPDEAEAHRREHEGEPGHREPLRGRSARRGSRGRALRA